MRLLLVFAAAAPLFAQNLCPYGIAPSQLLNIPAIYPGNSITVFADSDCTWTYSTDSPWITFTSGPAKGIGSGRDNIGWSAAANVSPTVRQAKISVTGATGNVLAFTVSQAGAICAITLPQPSASIGVSGGSGTFPVQANCTWSASGSGWITVPANTGGTTNGTVSYTVPANVCASQRSGAISVMSFTARQQFQINQDGSPGDFAASPTSLTVSPAGVTGSVIYVTTGAGCSWSATVDVSWITLLSGKSAASNVAGAVSPGEIVTLYGANIGLASPASFQVNADGTYAKSLGGTQVLFDGVPVGLTYASAVQVNAVAPYGLAPGATTQVQVGYQGVLSNALSVPVQAAHPGLFTVDSSGLGRGAACPQTECGGRLPV